MENEALVKKYQDNLALYEHLCRRMEKYLMNLLKEENIAIHTIVSRTKSVDSLAKKDEELAVAFS